MMWSLTYLGSPCPASSRSFSFACAISRATTMVPERERRVLIGYLLSSASTSFIGRLTSILTTLAESLSSFTSGRYLDGSVSSFSRNTPSLVIFPLACLSAEHDTPKPTGHEAPCLGRRTTRTSWQKYLPPNCAPMPIFWHCSWILLSHSRSRNALPPSFPLVCSSSRYLVLASFTVLSVCSALRPPTTRAMWYGGHADVPNIFTFSSMNSVSEAGFSSALVCWKRKVLFAEPPPLARYKNLYSSPLVA
mmetsp:Transcript_39369/g.80647  ORF Transcript_39369/g.80647 Transcript_39369/m.80647 type:complete len:249 (-) Transcript_39369:568-1314(-)